MTAKGDAAFNAAIMRLDREILDALCLVWAREQIASLSTAKLVFEAVQRGDDPIAYRRLVLIFATKKLSDKHGKLAEEGWRGAAVSMARVKLARAMSEAWLTICAELVEDQQRYQHATKDLGTPQWAIEGKRVVLTSMGYSWEWEEESIT